MQVLSLGLTLNIRACVNFCTNADQHKLCAHAEIKSNSESYRPKIWKCSLWKRLGLRTSSCTVEYGIVWEGVFVNGWFQKHLGSNILQNTKRGKFSLFDISSLLPNNPTITSAAFSIPVFSKVTYSRALSEQTKIRLACLVLEPRFWITRGLLHS